MLRLLDKGVGGKSIYTFHRVMYRTFLVFSSSFGEGGAQCILPLGVAMTMSMLGAL